MVYDGIFFFRMVDFFFGFSGGLWWFMVGFVAMEKWDMPNSSARLNNIEVFESRGFQDGLNLAKRSFDTQKKAHFTGDRAGYVAMWLGWFPLSIMSRFLRVLAAV